METSHSVVLIKDIEIDKNFKSTNEVTLPEDEDVKIEGTGSGFVWDKAGHIVTNYVIEKLARNASGLKRCKVLFVDTSGKSFSKEGKLIGFDPAYDLAVLKVDVEGNELKPVMLGTSDDWMTEQVVSGLGREIPSPNGSAIRGAIQTDAAINTGNSGGPFIDSYGRVIGVSTSTFTRKGLGLSSGVNFVIPVDTVVKTIPYLIVNGTPFSNRMLAHKFVEQSSESDLYLKKQKTKKSWWSLGWTGDSVKDESEPWRFGEEDWERLNKIIGYKESDGAPVMESQDKGNTLRTSLEVHMKHNASKRVAHQQCLAELSCEDPDYFVMLYSEAKVFDLKLGSYRLSSPHGLLAESATIDDSLVGVFTLKPFGTKFDWSLIAKASPCYMTGKHVINTNRMLAMTYSLLLIQMTIDEVKRTAQQQVTRALKDHARDDKVLCHLIQRLIIPFEMQGFQRVYNLERKIYDAAARGLCPVKGPQHVKFPLPNPHDPFSLKPGSLASNLIGVKPHEVEKPPNLTAAFACAQTAAAQFSKREREREQSYPSNLIGDVLNCKKASRSKNKSTENERRP
ncbi:Protease do-like 5 protein [Thalictrum thalictroides]|uniref:Protease do-like 5 protein n=1 Tax=Thalictrum thalictroides TaxID=46969 RepID=A0A7J6VZG4_THATH|nr:Protease do-like 5 protein [Thalictrum thalictroides]